MQNGTEAYTGRPKSDDTNGKMMILCKNKSKMYNNTFFILSLQKNNFKYLSDMHVLSTSFKIIKLLKNKHILSIYVYLRGNFLIFIMFTIIIECTHDEYSKLLENEGSYKKVFFVLFMNL